MGFRDSEDSRFAECGGKSLQWAWLPTPGSGTSAVTEQSGVTAFPSPPHGKPRGQGCPRSQQWSVGSRHDSGIAPWDQEPCSADFQSAVSRVLNPQAPSITEVPGNLNALAQTNARPTESRRYGRLKNLRYGGAVRGKRSASRRKAADGLDNFLGAEPAHAAEIDGTLAQETRCARDAGLENPMTRIAGEPGSGQLG